MAAECWAKALKNCEGSITKEHLISDSLLEKKVKIKGLSWCKDEVKEIGSASLVSNVLCKKHNSALSYYDNEIKKFDNEITAWGRRAKIVKKYGLSAVKAPVVIKMNGSHLEKWFTKTLINIIIADKQNIKVYLDGILPVVFGSEGFDKPYGLYFASEVGQQIVADSSVEWTPLINSSSELTGGLYRFAGFRFVLILPNSTPPLLIDGELMNIQTNDALMDWHKLRLSWHHKLISHQMVAPGKNSRPSRSKAVVQELHFSWD